MIGETAELTRLDINRIERGAEYLDRIDPDWFETINMPRLDINSPNDCILGQLYGDYFDAKDELNFSTRTCLRHGFYMRKVYANVFDEHVANMTRQWKQVILQRRINKQSELYAAVSVMGHTSTAELFNNTRRSSPGANQALSAAA